MLLDGSVKPQPTRAEIAAKVVRALEARALGRKLHAGKLIAFAAHLPHAPHAWIDRGGHR